MVRSRWAAWLLVAAGVAAYHNSFAGPWLMDDAASLNDNLSIRYGRPVWYALVESIRPVTDFSFALNYALGGLDVRGYHAGNLAIHLTAALLLFGLLRRSFRQPVAPAALRARADGLALSASLLWVVHPLTTQSVTYLVQRAESLMGLWVLLTLYATCRGATPGARPGWYALAVLATLLGMATKPVMAIAPLVVLTYDRVFLASSFRQALRQRRALYLGLAAGWGVLGGLLLTAPDPPTPTAGFGMEDVNVLAYVATQPGVICHYLRLALWPHPLVFDYAWPMAKTVSAVLPPALVLVALLAATGWLFRRRPVMGFWAIWVFLTLAPTSSIVPLADFAFEHRMYLPLIGLLVLAVLGADALLQRLAPRPAWGPAALVGAFALLLAVLTIRRNADYRSERSLWSQTVQQRPRNPRAHISLGNALALEQRYDEASAHYAAALELDADSAEAHNNWGIALLRQHQLTEAVTHFSQALRRKPDYAEVHFNLANALALQERFEEANRHYAQASRLAPDFPGARVNWGNVLALQGDVDGAIAQYTVALRLAPNHVVARHNLERLRSRAGD